MSSKEIYKRARTSARTETKKRALVEESLLFRQFSKYIVVTTQIINIANEFCLSSK